MNPDTGKVEPVKYMVVKPIFDRRSGTGNVMKFSSLPQDLQTRAHNQHAVAEASRRGKFKHPATMQRNLPVSEYIEAGVFSRETGRNESVFGSDLPKTTTNELATWARTGFSIS